MGVKGQLHVLTLAGLTVLEGDTNGDTLADFQIVLSGVAPTVLQLGDLVL